MTTTWSWQFGVSGTGNTPADWSIVSGPGNSSGTPDNGDTGINSGGTINLGPDGSLSSNIVELGGTAGVAALIFNGDTGINFNNPSLDQNTVINNLVPGATTAETSVITANGNFVNAGTIFANGPTSTVVSNGATSIVDSITTINIGTNVSNGITYAGQFYNADLIEVDKGNQLSINVGAGSELVNTGLIFANGGSILITASPSAILGGYAPVLGFIEIANGGTVETQSAYPASVDNANTSFGTAPYYAFGDGVSGDTLKIDNAASFGGRILNFQQGDTINLGTSLAVTSLSLNANGILTLNNGAGSALASLALSNSTFSPTAGTVALSGGSADGFTVGTGADGNTILTATISPITGANVSGTWQSASSWAGGSVPGSTATPVIGLTAGGGSVSNFTLTTGSAPVVMAGLNIIDHHATLSVTSNTTMTTGLINDLSGSILVTAGNTLTTTFVRTVYQEASVTVAAGATLNITDRQNIFLAPIAGVYPVNTSNTSAATFGSGTVEIDGAMLAGPSVVAGSTVGGGAISIGYDSGGTAQMTVTGQVTDTHLIMGSDPTSSGTLTLNGTAASWADLYVPVTDDPISSRGNVTVGYNDQANNTPAALTQPDARAQAVLTIENGAVMTEQVAGLIANTVNSSGSVMVTTGGVWNMAAGTGTNAGDGYLRVGQSGSGTLTVVNGGTVKVGNLGTFFSSGTSYTAGGILIGQTATGNGTLAVSGSFVQNGTTHTSLLTTADGITVGDSGTGLLDIFNGGSVSISNKGIGIGTTLGASGTVIVGGNGAPATVTMGSGSSGITAGGAGSGTVDIEPGGTIAMSGTGGIGVGSTANATGSLIVNGGLLTQAVSNTGIGLGQASGVNASMLIENAGTVILNGGGISVATTAAADSGQLTVTGTHSLLRITSTNALNVGNTGFGTLTVNNGGTVSLTNAASGISVGQSANAAGQVSVYAGQISGAGSLRVGNAGIGALGIQGGGQVTVGTNATIAVTAGASGSMVNVVGTGSNWQVTGAVAVGAAGAGGLSVSAGGQVTAGSLDDGVSASGIGQVEVTGTGSSLTLSGNLILGDAGTGFLSILGGAVVSAANINIGGVKGSSGSVFISGAGSTLTATGALTIGSPNGGVGDLTVGPGAFIKASSITYYGSAVLEGGTIDPTVQTLTGSNKLGGTGQVGNRNDPTAVIIDESKVGIAVDPNGTLLVIGTIVGGGGWSENGTVQSTNFAASKNFGLLDIGDGGTMELTGPVLSGGTFTTTDLLTPTNTYTITGGAIDVTLDGPGSVLKLDNIAGFGGTITSIQPGGSFVITTPGTTDALANLNIVNGRTLTFTDNGTAEKILFGAGFALDPSGFSIVNGNTIVACFLAGTRIATPDRRRTVETLLAGDEVATQLGGPGRIMWVGSRAIDCSKHPRPEQVWPIRIAAHAVARNVPERDLYVSPDHALYLDGVLIPAKHLVNGMTITQVKRRRVVYHHIELERHDVVLAEGMPAETYLDTGDRAKFSGGRITALHPDFAARIWEMAGCAPLVTSGTQRDRIRARLTARSPRAAVQSTKRLTVTG